MAEGEIVKNNNPSERRPAFSSNFSGARNKRRTPGGDNFRLLEKEILDTKRVVKVTRGGRRFSIASLVLVRDPEKNAISYVYVSGKEMSTIIKKALQKARKKMIPYFPTATRTIPNQILVKYKATSVFMKPTPSGTGIKAGTTLNTFFKYLQIKDVSAKIIGSCNKLNVIRAAFLAMDKLTGKKYDY